MRAQKSTKAKVTASILRFFMGVLMTALFYILAFLMIRELAKTVYSFSYEVFGSQVMDSEPGRSITIMIGESDTMHDVAKTLEQQKIIVDSSSFEMRAALTEKEIVPGTYTVNSSQTYAEILDILDNGLDKP